MSKKTDPKVAEAVMLKAGLKPLEPYTNSTTRWKCECLNCGRITHPQYGNIKQGHSGCKPCAYRKNGKKQRLNEKEATAIMLQAGLKTLEPYISTDVGWKSECLICGNIVKPRLNSIKRGQGGCTFCANREQGTKKLFPEKQAVAIMLKAGFETLEPYAYSNKAWKCRCLKCKRIVYPTFGNVKNSNTGCPYCEENKIDPEDAILFMLKARLEPLVPYPGRHSKWKCKCLKCGEIVYPAYGSIKSGQGGCIYCADIGFKHKEPAYFYIIFHPDFDSVKVGISNENSYQNRLTAFFKDGWQLHYKYDFKIGSDAVKIEREILRWIREDLDLPIHLSLKQMPITGGHTETVSADSITVIEIKKRVDQIIKGYNK